MIVTVKNKEPLVVPPAVRRRAGFKSGQELEFKTLGGVITIAPRSPRVSARSAMAGRTEVEARLAKADEDIKAGRVYGPFETARQMADSIEANIKRLRAAKRQAKPRR